MQCDFEPNSNKFLLTLGFVIALAHAGRQFLDEEHLELGPTLKHLILPN